MTFARVWPTGITNNTPAGGAQLTQLDINVAKSLDGAAGGKSSPTTILKISGAGLQVSDASDDAPFVTAGAKWLGAAMDFQSADSLSAFGAQLDDITGQTEGLLVAVDASTTASLKVSTDGGSSWQQPSPITGFGANIFQCCAGSRSGAALGAGVTIFGATNGQCRFADLASAGFSVSVGIVASTLTLPGSPTSIDFIHYDAVNNQFIAIGKTAGGPYLATITNATTPVATQRTVPASITGSNAGLKVSQSSGGRLLASWVSQTNVAYSNDGITWTASTSTLPSGNYTHSFGDGVFLATTPSSINILSSTDGSTWSTAATGPGIVMSTARCFTNLHGVFVISSGGTLAFSVDRGATWTQVAAVFRRAASTGSTVSRCVRALQGRLFFLMTGDTQIFRSRKLGSVAGF